MFARRARRARARGRPDRRARRTRRRDAAARPRARGRDRRSRRSAASTSSSGTRGGPPPGTARRRRPRTRSSRRSSCCSRRRPARARSALPHLEKSAGGRILAITSLAAKEPTDASRALEHLPRPALIGWLKTLARELGPQGITVNCVAPGRIDTARLDAALSATARPTERARARSRCAAGARRASSATSSASSPPTARATSRGTDDRRRRRPAAVAVLMRAPPHAGARSLGALVRVLVVARRRALPRPVGRLPPPARPGASGRAARPGHGRQRPPKRPGGIYFVDVFERARVDVRDALPVDPPRRRRSCRRGARAAGRRATSQRSRPTCARCRSRSRSPPRSRCASSATRSSRTPSGVARRRGRPEQPAVGEAPAGRRDRLRRRRADADDRRAARAVVEAQAGRRRDARASGAHGKTKTLTDQDVADPRTRGPRDHRRRRRAGRRHQAAAQGRRSTPATSAALRPASRSRSR